jgi:glutamate carboxypeptidase
LQVADWHITMFNETCFLTRYLESQLPAALDWLQRLVEVNSFTANSSGVNRVVSLSEEMFLSLGFKSERVPSENASYGDHLFLFRPGKKKGKPVLLVTHSDTVFPEEEELRENFRWQKEEGRIYGPGTVDNKGGTALIWLMLHGLREVAPEVFDSTSWIIASNASEEVTASDFGRLTRERCPDGALCVLVFEGGPKSGIDHQIVMARKGRAEFVIRSIGRAAHAGSNHAEGLNAIVSLSRCVEPIAALTDPTQELTINIATVKGGTVLNRVPHEAELAFEMRAYDPSVLIQAEAQIEAILENLGSLTLHCNGRTPGWPADEATRDLCRHWQAVAGDLNLAITPTKRGGLSDANYLAGLGPMLDGMGPSGANAHCSERNPTVSKWPEFVDLGSFVSKAALNVLALQRLLVGS